MTGQRLGDHFLEEPDVSPQSDGVHWVLKSQLDYWMNDENGSSVISIPAGFVTDFASVPRIFWNIFPPWGRYGNGSILHDWLYTKQEFTRARSDRIFLDAMAALGVNWISRWTIYLALRSGGWIAWNQHREINIKIS